MSLLISTLLLQGPVTQFRATPDPGFHAAPDLQLTRVRGLTRAPNGDILLVDQPGDQIYRLSQSGALLPPLARTGAGPGEVRSVGSVGWRGDSLWVSDLHLRRISTFGPSLRFAYSRPDTERCGETPWAIAPDGRCVVMPQPFVPPDKPIPLELPVLLTRPGGPTDTLGSFILPRMVIRYANGESHMNQPFADTPIPIFSKDGRYFAWLERRPHSPTGPPAIQVRLRDFQTGRQTEFLAPFQPEPLRDDSVEAYLAQATKPFGPNTVAGFADSVTRRLYRPRMLPAFSRAILDRSGRLWLQNQHRPGAPDILWRVFEFSGTPAFELRLPDRFSPGDIAADRLLGTVLDDDEVPTLVQFRYGPAR